MARGDVWQVLLSMLLVLTIGSATMALPRAVRARLAPANHPVVQTRAWVWEAALTARWCCVDVAGSPLKRERFSSPTRDRPSTSGVPCSPPKSQLPCSGDEQSSTSLVSFNPSPGIVRGGALCQAPVAREAL